MTLGPKLQVPGPGTYQPKNDISLTGNYFLSTMQSSKAMHFAKGPRIPSTKTVNGSRASTPGPGSYRVPSEFGYYEKKGSSIEKRANKTTVGGFLGWTNTEKRKRISIAGHHKTKSGGELLTSNKSVPDLSATAVVYS